MPIYKASLRFHDANSGLGWSINTYRAELVSADVQIAANTFWNAYRAVCGVGVTLDGLTISDVALLGDSEFFDASLFTHQTGLGGAPTIPMAEAILLTGRDNTPASLGRSRWYLHGILNSVLFSSGALDPSNAAVIALRGAAAAFLYQYRAVATPVFHWPVVLPPQPFAFYDVSGPFVRRLGRSFFLPGQQHRYQT